MQHARPPGSETELLDRVGRLGGRTLGELAALLGATVPPDLSRHKGWMGTLLEAALGADAGSRPVPDFEGLGIELKTLPIDASGRVRESTFVTSVPADGSLAGRWEDSRVRHKLSRVLWVPLVGSGSPGERTIGPGFLWTPDSGQEAALRHDWEELAGLIALGEHWQIDARRGSVMQLRPKAAHSQTLAWTLDGEGDWVREGPKAFYLRARFTSDLLNRRFRR